MKYWEISCEGKFVGEELDLYPCAGVEGSTRIEFWMSTYIQVVIAGLQVSSRMLMTSSSTAVTGLRCSAVSLVRAFALN